MLPAKEPAWSVSCEPFVHALAVVAPSTDIEIRSYWIELAKSPIPKQPDGISNDGNI
jgi:hypothetical protein